VFPETDGNLVEGNLDPILPWDSAIQTSSLSSAIQLTSALYPEEGNSKNFAAMIVIVKEADV
jgi:hypothetical protein